jgi:anti-anti-sigma regulatory factor
LTVLLYCIRWQVALSVCIPIPMTTTRITLILLLVLFAASLLFLVQGLAGGGGAGSSINAIAVLTLAGLLALHLWGWRHSPVAVVLCLAALVVLGSGSGYLRTNFSVSVLVPAVVACVLLPPRWIVPVFAAVLLSIAARVAFDNGGLSLELLGPTFTLENQLLLIIIVVGITLASMVARQAQRLAELNAQTAMAAQQQLEVQARALDREVVVAQAARSEAEAARGALAEQLTTIEAQQAVIQEMSVPVLPITEAALLMPLIGALDNSRLRVVQERALEMLERRSGARYLLLDITGIPVVDTEVASELMRLVQAVRLLGSQVVVVGIRPEVAQTLVGLGLALDSVITRGTLQDGIAYVLRHSAVEPTPGPAVLGQV